MAKPRIIKDFDKLDIEIQEQIKLSYPTGFFEHLVSYTDRDGNGQWALPFETEDKYYLVRMSIAEAKKLINDDDDYDDNGVLRDDIQEMYQEKYSDDIDEFDADFGTIEVAAKDIELDIKSELGVDEEDEEEEDENKKTIDDFDDDDEDDIDDDDEIGEEDYDEEEDEEEE